jgi:hypothetical protein
MLLSGVGYSAEKASVLWDTVHRKRFCCGVGYNGSKAPALWDTMEKTTSIISHFGRKTPALWDTMEKFVSHPEIVVRCISQRRKLFPLYPTTEENLFSCIPQRKKCCCAISHNGKKT